MTANYITFHRALRTGLLKNIRTISETRYTINTYIFKYVPNKTFFIFLKKLLHTPKTPICSLNGFNVVFLR